MKRFAVLAGLVSAGLASAGGAKAAQLGATYGATYSGTASGTDVYGVFGAPGSTLSNASYTEQFIINTASGTKYAASGEQDENTPTRQAAGNAEFIVGTITINGRSATVASGYYGEAFVNDSSNSIFAPPGGLHSNPGDGYTNDYDFGGLNATHVVYDFAGDDAFTVSQSGIRVYADLSGWAYSTSSSFFPSGLDQSFQVALGGGSGATGGGTFQLFDALSDARVEDITLKPTTAAAPEPGTWALMLGGVGMIGAAMRIAYARRREDEVKAIATA